MPKRKEITRNQLLGHGIDDQPQSFEGRGPQNGGLALLAESDLYRGLSSINLYEDGRHVPFQAAAIRERKGKPGERRDTQILQDLLGNP